MALSSRSPMLAAQAGLQRDLKAAFLTTADSARGRLLHSVISPNDPVPIGSLTAIQRDVGLMVERLFVGQDGRSAYAADGRTPLSPFATILNRWIVRETAQIVRQHSAFMRARLPEDVLAWLRRAKRPAREQLTSPQALLAYEPTWTWLDARGYTLSDRIWNASLETRRRIDALLADGIRSGRAAFSLANELERFLVPGRAALRTNRPYGQDASFWAMNLARSEISLQAARVSVVSARQNPFVEAVIWNLSGSHPKDDICDSLAAGSPYPVDRAPLQVIDSHPQCLCFNTYEVRPSSEVIDELRGLMADGEEPYTNPVDETGFLLELLGMLLAGIAQRELLTI